MWGFMVHRERARRLEAGGFGFCLQTRTERASKPTEARGAPFAAIYAIHKALHQCVKMCLLCVFIVLSGPDV